MSKIITYNKLVRDNIPEIIGKNGGKVKFHIIKDDEEFKKTLRAKLIEEIEELFNADTEEEIIEELADIITVLWHLDPDIVPKMTDTMMQKGYEKGWFSKSIFLESVEFEEDECEEGT